MNLSYIALFSSKLLSNPSGGPRANKNYLRSGIGMKVEASGSKSDHLFLNKLKVSLLKSLFALD